MASAPLNWLARIGGATLNTHHATLIADALNEIHRNVANTVAISSNGDVITRTYADNYKTVTTIVSASQVTVQYYLDNVLYATKTIMFGASGVTETFA